LRRHRTVAAAPERSASESWGVVAELVVTTLERSPAIARPDVEAELSIAAGVGRALIAGGHLDSAPLVVKAGKLDLAIKTASGNAAFSITENLSPVPGAADAEDWTVHLPAVPPLAESVTSVAASGAHLSADDPDELAKESSARTRESLDAAAVQRWADEQA
jgi:hypothetical protein